MKAANIPSSELLLDPRASTSAMPRPSGLRTTFPLRSYLIVGQVAYLCIADKSYPRKLAFSYLDELSKEFERSYGTEVGKPNLRPYAFVKFDTFVRFSPALPR